MGGVFGHMSHIYDNPYMTFGQIKDIMQQASAGELQGTEKTDGQNLFVSYNVQDGTVRAARNKGNIKAGGMTPAELLEKFEGRGALTDAFVNSFYAFEEAVESFSDEEKLTAEKHREIKYLVVVTKQIPFSGSIIPYWYY